MNLTFVELQPTVERNRILLKANPPNLPIPAPERLPGRLVEPNAHAFGIDFTIVAQKVEDAAADPAEGFLGHLAQHAAEVDGEVLISAEGTAVGVPHLCSCRDYLCHVVLALPLVFEVCGDEAVEEEEAVGLRSVDAGDEVVSIDAVGSRTAQVPVFG